MFNDSILKILYCFFMFRTRFFMCLRS